MTESYPEYVQEPPQFEIEINYPVAFALEEYIADRQVGLTRAVYDMARLGLSATELILNGCSIEAQYSDGEQSYTAPEEMDLDKIDQVRRIRVAIPQELQDSIRLMAMRCELADEEMFARLIEEARTLRIVHKRGGMLICTHPDGRVVEIILPQEED